MEGEIENPIEVPSSPSSSQPTTPSKTTKDRMEEFPSRASSECSSNKSSSEKTPPLKHSYEPRSSVVTGDLFHDNASTCSSTSSTTTSSVPPLNKRFPIRPGIVWRKGEKIEAMDFIEKWYPAKIIEIDEDDIAVLIHFEGWNQRYDQWMDMGSEKIRPKARHSGRKEKRKSLNNEYKVGDQVYARWTDCKMYPAKITAIQAEDTFEVFFYDGFKKVVQGMNIKPMPPELKQQKIEIVHVLPKDMRKRSSTDTEEGKKRLSTETEDGKNRLSMESEDGKKRLSTDIEDVKMEPLTESEAAPSGFEVEAALVLPLVEEPAAKRHKRERNPETRRKAMARKRQRMFISGSLFVSRRRPKPKPKKSPVKHGVLPRQNLPVGTPVSSPSVPGIASTPNIPIASSSQTKITSSLTGNFPSTPSPLSPVTLISVEKKNKKRILSPAISETSSESQSEDHQARARRRSRSSTAEDRAAVMYTPPTIGLPPKGFVVEQDHNHFKCMFEGCTKGFRKEQLLDSHIKYYHMDFVQPSLIRKRRKTSSICSTDSDTSQVDIKKRHMSADSALQTINQEHEDVDVDDMHKAEHREEVIVETEPKQEVDTMATEESIETEDELSKDEVVNCICMVNEENGLMIQCEVCLCWQHALCFDLTEETLPRKYICFVCKDPPAVRDSCRYIHDQEWLKTGELAQFNFLPSKMRDENKCRTNQATHSLVADTLNISRVIHGVKQKILALEDKNHPEYKLWKKNWDEEPEDIIADEHESVTMEMDDEKCENLDLLESAAKMNSELGKTSEITEKSGFPRDKSVGVCVAKTENDKHEDENLIHDSMDRGAQSEEEAGKDSSGESSVNADSESTLSAPEAIAHQNMQDHEASMAEESIQGEIIEEKMETEEVEENVNVEKVDPYVNCEKNLLHHIIKMQSVLDERLDLIEEQVSALESTDTEDNPSDILSDLPSIKKSLHMLQNDLVKVGRMAAYHR
ncbi:PHD finger protein 20-like protein 1 isoform X5 [Mytilus californianus]|uniref:PHD finger protein 20-like protein 1 isoform X5 n=1 Tax=Mytilus californianus TaxID=6549 RepID=UPI00224690AD|nr:PHD finger protein 20-like protein 1 isoform X5 [Mytilus californianus]